MHGLAAANGMCRPGGKLCVGCRVVQGSALTGWDACAIGPKCGVCSTTAYTQFATWAAVNYLARRAVTRTYEAGEAYRKSVGNEHGLRDCRVKRKTLWGPSGKY
ncbi:hypothetical protein PTKU15_74380 [Paraburkholderia terrae]|nr:hypothetical protein PTKU15_74380 [Paraburkholderia terrae]